MLAFFLLLAVATQSPQCAGANCGAGTQRQGTAAHGSAATHTATADNPAGVGAGKRSTAGSKADNAAGKPAANNPGGANKTAGAGKAANAGGTSGAAEGSYLVKVIDLKQVMKTAQEPCISIFETAGQSAAAVKGLPFHLTLRLAAEVPYAAPVRVNGELVHANAPGQYVYTFVPPMEGRESLKATVDAAPGSALRCDRTVTLVVPVIDTRCKGMRFKAAAGGGGDAGAADAATIAGLLGSPAPLMLKTPPQQEGIYVYSASDNTAVNNAAIEALMKSIALLPAEPAAGKTGGGLAMEMPVPRDVQGDSLAGVGSTRFKVSLKDTGVVEIAEAKGVASCGDWLAELRAVQQRTLTVPQEPRESQLFYLASANDTAGVLAKAIAASAGGTTAPAKPAVASASVPAAATVARTVVAAAPAPDSGSDASTSPDANAAGDGTSAQKKTGRKGAKGQQSDGSGAPPAKQGTAPASGEAGQGFTVQGLQTDLLVYGGDDASIRQAKRVLAMLDLPRPEMILNTWILQASTSNAEEIGQFSETARRLVSENNKVLQQGIERGWESLANSAQHRGFFDESFYRYVAYRYVAYRHAGDADEEIPLDEDDDDTKADTDGREATGICPRGEYCLGYTTLFTPLRPRLTDMLIAMIASNDGAAVVKSIDATENLQKNEAPSVTSFTQRGKDTDSYSFNEARKLPTKCQLPSCNELRRRLGIGDSPCGTWSCVKDEQSVEKPENVPEGVVSVGKATPGCGLRDLEQLIDTAAVPENAGAKDETSAGGAVAQFVTDGSTNLQLECLREVVVKMFVDRRTQFLARAAIADFLYQYKLSQQYPREFSPYNLTLSADTFNTALAPFIDAFNRDIRAFQDYLNNVVRMKVDCQKCGKAITFTDTGLVSVRTVSVNQTEVSSTTQSSLDTGEFPDVATVAANLLGGSGDSGSGKGSSSAASSAAAGLLAANQAALVLGALKSFQTSTAQIGRQIDVKVTPRSLSGASAAEMDVTLKVDDAGTPPSKYTGTTSSALNLSRVATHDTTTHVRVDSLKLFDVSSVGAELTLSRPPIPLILPLVELPYIGSLVGIPRKPAEEFHSSVAIMSAIVVPTATDLAYGMTFAVDQIIVAPEGSCRMPWLARGDSTLPMCETLVTGSQQELEGPIHAFHSVKSQCLSTGGRLGYAALPSSALTKSPCDRLKFDTMIPE